MSEWYHYKPFVHRQGFTFFELLLVLVIIGVMVATVVPRISSGMAGTQLATSARSVLQATRYARTMALLHQSKTQLTFDPDSGSIKVQASAGTDFIAQQLEDIKREKKEAMETGLPGDDNLEEEAELAAMTNRAAVVTSAKAFAEEIDMEFESKDVSFAFLGYTDTIDDVFPDSSPDGDKQPFTIFFQSNGTCRPFRMRVMNTDDPENLYMDIAVDPLGTGKIEGYGEE